MESRKGFESEYAANKFAEKVGGKVEFKPLPDYMGMIQYWVVRWQDKEQEVG